MALLAGIVCLLAILSKLIGCGLGSVNLGVKDAIRIGMVPRREARLIGAAARLPLHTISDAIYAVVVLMSIVTTLLAPPAWRQVLPGAAEEAA